LTAMKKKKRHSHREKGIARLILYISCSKAYSKPVERYIILYMN
jgi:hypothetical protein